MKVSSFTDTFSHCDLTIDGYDRFNNVAIFVLQSFKFLSAFNKSLLLSGGVL